MRISRLPPADKLQPIPSTLSEPDRASLASQTLEREREAWLAMSPDPPGLKTLREVADKTERRAASAARDAFKSDDATAWHDLRKLVKRLRYQREFLAELRGEKPNKRDARLRRLGTLLGKRNDLDNLKRLLVDSESDQAALGLCLARVGGREARLIEEARELGRSAFESRR